MDDTATPGWYGKLPMLGDFASRRLPQVFIDVCDDWLSRGIDASRAQLGDEWLNTYLTGPLWRFAWADGVVDGRWWWGVLMPSVDRVGRYFPLVVALVLPAAPRAAQGLRELDELQRRMGRAALATLRPQATLDDFDSTLCTMPLTAGLADAPAQVQHLPGRQRLCWPAAQAALNPAQHPALSAAAALCASELTPRLAGHSLWWLEPGGDEHTLSVTPGLPPAEHFRELLQGSW
jgi:type VI secretion system protein ImpM